MEVVISIAAKVAELLVVPIGKQICYPFNYKTNMEELKKQVQKLTDRREMVQHSVDEAKRQGEEIEKFVEEWMKTVDEFAEKVVKPITEDEDKAGKLCSIGFCSNLMMRYSLSKKAEKTAKDGMSLLEKGTFRKVSYCPAIQRTKSVYTRGYEDFDSRMPVFEDIMEALADEDVNLIGVYGMGGVGKTTLVKRVAAHASEDKLFDVVVMAEVTQTLDIKSLQGQIADELGLKFDKESLPGRAAQLREKLKNETSILLILDNIWEKLDLDAVGIPFWNDEKPSVTQEVDQRGRNANKRKWKLLLTSRDLDVLRNDMNTQKNFFVDILSDVEATELFWKIVNHLKEKADFNPIAVEIVRKCAGLPIAITTIANALENKDLPDWKNALQWLRKSNPKFIKGWETSVYATIELSYNVLGPEEQSLFLLCSLIDSGFGLHTNDLFKYSMGLNLFGEVNTLENARNRMHTLISTLKASSLLLDGNAKGHVKMHDIIHAVAVSIASSADKLMFNIQNVTSIKEMLEDRLPKDSVALSHLYGNIKELPEMLEFPNLKFLNLSQIERLSLQIPDALFNYAKKLEVLHLTNFDLSSLPSSLCNLTNLQTLYLDQCLIDDIAIIGELKKLEILSFSRSEIEQLPKEIGQLTRLRLLDLSNCSKLTVIASNVISSLTQLEELYMGNSFDQWDVNGQRNASLVELKKLSNLTTLEIQVLETQIIPPDLFFGNLERYKIFIADVRKWSNIYSTLRMLKLKLNNSLFSSNEINFLLNRVEDLYLDEPKGVKNVLQELNGEGFQQLKHLHIQNAPHIQNVFQCRWLDQLPAMSSFCRTLTKLTVEECGGLEFLFPYSMVKGLVQLQELVVRNCKSMETIIKTEEIVGEERLVEMTFPKLILLHLIGLPKLTRIGSRNSIEFPSLTRLSIEDCPELKTFSSALTLGEMNCRNDIHPLFNEKVGFPSLEEMIISGMDNLESIWHNQVLEDSFCKLKSVEVNDCQMLTTIFPSFLCGTLLKLESVTVKSCGLVEKIFDLQGLGKHSIEKVQLKALYVDHLSNLKHIWNEDPKGMLSYRKLQKVTVFLCPNLKNLFPASVARSLENLESLEVSDCGVEEIIANEGMKEVAVRFFFPQLNSLQLHNLPELTTFYQVEHTVLVPRLKTFGLHHCDKVKPPFPLVRKLKGTTNLEELQLSGNAIEMTKLGQVLFGSLKSLELNDHESTDFPLDFIQIFGSLRKLSLNFCLYTEIFSDAEVEERPQIKHLVLSQLYNLQQIWKPGSKIDLYSQYLETLQVRSCVNLTNLMPSSSSFEKLTILEVWGCEQLKNLLTLSTAKSLAQLEKLEVFDCKMLTEMVANEGATTEEVTFSKMKSLSLSYLESLASFCPVKHKLNFPTLESLVVNECPKMKIFSRGAMNTPRYCQLELNWKAIKRSGEVDINTTIQQNIEKRLLGREDCNDPSTD